MIKKNSNIIFDNNKIHGYVSYKNELRKEDVDFIKGVCTTFNNDPKSL